VVVAGVLDWNTAILPVLEAANECSCEPEGFANLGEVDVDAVNRHLERKRHDPRTVAALRSLARGGYIEVTDGGPDQVDGPRLFALTDKALQLVAGWPSTTGEAALQKLLAELEERIDAEPDEEKRSKLVKLRGGLVDVGKDVAAGVLTKIFTGE
jgi:hypothetical protein